MSRMSTTPLMMPSKWVRKLSEAIRSTTNSGAQPLKAASTSSSPLIMKTKQTAAAITKAITWLRVSAETKQPIDRNAPAIRKLAM